MLTIDDVRSVPLFSTLGVAELELLAGTSADLHLGAGEFAVPEGGERALYAVLTGKIEVVKLFDGIERTLGWRVPGTIFGEVPIAFGTVFVGGYRASEPSRVFRVDPKHYYAIAATSPEVVAKIGALARERIGGLQGIAASRPRRVWRWSVTVGTPHAASCASSSRATRLPMSWMTPDAPELSTRWPGTRQLTTIARAAPD
jgi:thioredoxin reductase (NADPH)